MRESGSGSFFFSRNHYCHWKIVLTRRNTARKTGSSTPRRNHLERLFSPPSIVRTFEESVDATTKEKRRIFDKDLRGFFVDKRNNALKKYDKLVCGEEVRTANYSDTRSVRIVSIFRRKNPYTIIINPCSSNSKAQMGILHGDRMHPKHGTTTRHDCFPRLLRLVDRMCFVQHYL